VCGAAAWCRDGSHPPRTPITINAAFESTYSEHENLISMAVGLKDRADTSKKWPFYGHFGGQAAPHEHAVAAQEGFVVAF